MIGHAEYLLGETRCVHELSGYFGLNNLGVTSPSELELRLVEIAWDGNPATPGMAGVLRLQGSLHSVDWLALPRSGIPFAANVVQGIGLNEAQVEAPLDTGLYGAVGA